MKALKMLIWIPVSIIIFYLAITVYIYFNQDKMVFYPSNDFNIVPDQVGLKFEDILVTTKDSAVIHGWYIPADSADSSKVVLFCHGNAGNISHRIETAQFLNEMGMSVYMFDYRGYGKSTGKPTEEGVYTDAEACYNWLIETKKYKPENIFIFGRSLGGAVGIELAGLVKSGGLIVESSFTTVGDVGKKMFPLFPIKQLVRYKFDSMAKIGKLNCPVLITHSPNDDLIPFYMGLKLFEAATEPKTFVEISGTHNSRTYFNESDYITALKELFQI